MNALITSLKEISLEKMKSQHFSTLAVSLIDFNKENFDSFQIHHNELWESSEIIFDLASITKALTLGVTYLKYPEIFDEELLSLIEHRAGIPSGGRLPKNFWREIISAYKISASATLYSDYSPLRAQLEIEKKQKRKLYDLAQEFWDKDIFHWSEIPEGKFQLVPTGFRHNREILGEVHDPNAYNLKEKLANAGLFGTVSGLSRTLLLLNKKLHLIEKISAQEKKRKIERFVCAFDSVTDSQNTLAGKGASVGTFGHLGFTGTSFWIDIQSGQGIVILSNGTQKYWYEKEGLNDIRRTLGAMVFTGTFKSNAVD